MIDTRIARLAMVRSYMAAVAAGDTALIGDPECSFLLDFLSAGQDRAATAAAPVAVPRRKPVAARAAAARRAERRE